MFEEIGYYKEFYIKSKFIGLLHGVECDRVIGYNGKKIEVLQTDVILSNNKKIKSGTEVMTMIYPLNGKKQ